MSIRFQCPTCDKHLAVTDEKAGKVAVCPGCKTRIRIPDAEPVEEPPPPPRKKAATTQAPVKRRPVDEDEPPRKRRPPPVDDDEDDIPEEELDRPRKRKKKKRRRPSEGTGLPLGMDYFTLALIGTVAFGLLLAGLSLLLPPVAIVVIGLGWLISFVGGIWFLIVAFKDDATQGVLCLLVPLYSIFYLIQNFDEAKRPFFVQLAGGVIAMAAICAGGLGAGRH